MDLKLKNNSNIVLPLYNQVKYIESTGTPNINTGISIYGGWTDGYIIDCAIEVLENVSGNSPKIYFNDYTEYAKLGINCSEDSNNTFIVYGRGTTSYQVQFSGKVTIQQRGYYSDSSNNYIMINGVKTTLTPTNVARTLRNICILNSGEVRTRIYSFKITKFNYNTGYNEVVRDYIPVISLQSGHIGEACLYDKVSNSYYYSSSTGSFTAPTQGFYDILTTAYIENCPNISGVDILRKCNNLSRVRCDIGNVSDSIEKLINWSTLSGFNDNYEEQTKPRLVGTADVTASYYTNSELSHLQSSIDGLVINVDTSKNIDTLLENDGFKVQVLDDTKPNYNPAACVIMYNSGNYPSWKVHYPIVEGGGLFYMPKAVNTQPGANIFRGKTTVVDTNGVVSDDTTAEYDFDSFEEFQYFNNTTVVAGTSTSALGMFGGCTKLKKIILPSTITTIGAYAFYNCTALESIVIPSTVTTIENYAFYNCTSIKNLYIPCSVNNYIFRSTNAGANYTIGAGTGELIIKGDLNYGDWNANGRNTFRFTKILIYGKTSTSGNGNNVANNHFIITNGIVRCKDIVRIACNNTSSFTLKGTKPFFEAVDDITAYGTNSRLTGDTIDIVHLGQTSVITATTTQMSIGSLTKIYLGDGSSKQSDEDVLALYTSDSDWSSYTSKLATWWDYNGEYKWYYVTDNLTNCINSNPDEWPHITRGESYQTTIIPDEGMALDSVTVEMYEAVDDGTTPNTPTDITSQVYDSSTGEINILAVTGNVIITASAS